MKSSPLNYIDPSGHIPDDLALANRKNLQKNVPLANSSDAKRANESITGQTSSESAKRELDEKQRKAWNYIKDLIQKAQDKTNDFVISCESYAAGVKVKINQKNSEFSVFILLLFGEDPSGEENRAKQYRNQILEGLEEIDYTSYEAGYIDGDWYYLLMFYDMVSAGMAGVNAVNNSLGSGGVLVTAEGVEIPGAVVVSGTEEGIASVSGGIITGLLAALGAAGDQEGGSGKGRNDSYSYKNGIYEKADYHSGQTTGKKNPAPKDGQFALDNSVPIGENTTRRVGIDNNGDFVVFDETTSGTFHGHVRTWNSSNGNQGLTQAMKNALYDAGYIKSPKGTSFKLTDYAKELIGK